MNNQASKHQTRKGFRETEDFQHFQKMVKSGFLSDGTSVTKPELLKFSEKLAKTLKRSDRRDSDTVNQFRRFFNQVSGLKNFDDAVQLQARLRLVKARMMYAAGRQIVSRDFNLVVQECIDSILEKEDIASQLPGFCGFFESLYAYFYYQTQRDVRRRRG